MTRRNRIQMAVLIIALLLTVSGSAWAGARRWSESRTVHYRSDLTIVIDGRMVTPEVSPFSVDPGWLMVPAEFIARELGAYVDWDDATSTLIITSGMDLNPIIEANDGTGPTGNGSAKDKEVGSGKGHDSGVSGGAGKSQDNGSANANNTGSATNPNNGPANDKGSASGGDAGGGKGAGKGPIPTAITKTLKEIISDVSPSVVLIATYDAAGLGISQGSGVVVGENTIITNQHVIHGASKVVAIDSADNLYVCSGTIAIDTHRDLALLKCDMPLSPVALGDSAGVAVGDDVVAIGNPRGLRGTVSTGIVSGPIREFSGVEYIQTNAPTSPGSSGGGLFAMDSSLIGITTLIFKDSQNLNLVVPVSYVKDLLARPADLKPYPATKAPNPTSETKPVARYFEDEIK